MLRKKLKGFKVKYFSPLDKCKRYKTTNIMKGKIPMVCCGVCAFQQGMICRYEN